MKTTSKAALLAGSLALGIAAFYPGLAVRRYTMPTGCLRFGTRLRFAVVSDLHSMAHGPRQEALLELLAYEKPDYILLPGDILDDWREPRPAADLFRGAAQIAPTFFAPGNHEYRTGRIASVFRIVERSGVTVLADRAVPLDTAAGRLVIAGAGDPERIRTEPRYRPLEAASAAFAGVKDDPGLRVLLVHRPERAELFRSFGFDLLVSGHAHGGQARILFLWEGLYAPGQGFFPRLTGGLYRAEGYRHLVSRGAGRNPFFPRIFNPPELVILDVAGMRLCEKHTNPVQNARDN